MMPDYSLVTAQPLGLPAVHQGDELREERTRPIAHRPQTHRARARRARGLQRQTLCYPSALAASKPAPALSHSQPKKYARSGQCMHH